MNLNDGIKDEYNFELKQYAPKSNIVGGFLSEKDIFDAHFVLADFFVDSGELARYGVLNFGLLSSAVSRQCVSFLGVEKWKNEYEKIATLVFGLVKNHAFNDGNKRTALLCMLMALHRKKRRLICKKRDVELLLVRIAANQMSDYKDFKKFMKHGEDAVVMYIANFLKKNSQVINNTFRTLTYEEFNKKLKVYGIRMANPQNCFIDVLQKEEKKYFLGLIRKGKEKRILNIGFPGWKRQINPKAVKNILKTCGLFDKGLDLKSFYEGSEPEYKLIEEYFEVLKRLKDE